MATLDVGKIKFTWKGAYADTTVYEADDVAQFSGSSYVYIGTVTPAAWDPAITYQQYNIVIGSDNKVYRYINAAAAANQDPTATSGYWELNQPGTASPATLFWDLMADGTNILTTQGDLVTHDGTNSIRLPRGNGGQVVKMDGNDVTWANEEGWSGMRVLQPNFGEYPADPNAATTYGANGSRPWLADYANNWIPQSGIPNTTCGPIQGLDRGVNDGPYRWLAVLNENHEVVQWGYDYYYMKYHNNGNRHAKGVAMNISLEFGGLREGDYFVRIWTSYSSIYVLTKDGDLFCSGYNGYGQLGVGDTTDRYNLVKIPGLGPDATHNGLSCRIAAFHFNSCSGTSMNNISCYAIDEHGRLFTWGHNNTGQLGIGNTTNQTRPQLVSVSNVVQVNAGYQGAFLVDNSGEMYYAGDNTNGVGAGASPNAFTTTSQTNVYACLHWGNYWYSGGWSFRSGGFYLNNAGDLYGIGRNNTGVIGNGATSDLSGWTKTSGSTKFASFHPAGMADYRTMYAIEGTPGNPNGNLYVWGYNGNGQLADGTTTNSASPQQPQTVTNYTRNTPVSTDVTIAPTLTPTSFPRNAIKRIFQMTGMQGQATHAPYVLDDKKRLWWTSHTNSRHYWQNNTGNSSNTNFVMDNGPWATTVSLTGSQHWTGKTATEIMDIFTFGNAYGSEGTTYCVTKDGRIWGWGYNGQGQIVDDQNYIDGWVQLAP